MIFFAPIELALHILCFSPPAFCARRFFSSSLSPALERIFRLCSFDFRSLGAAVSALPIRQNSFLTISSFDTTAYHLMQAREYDLNGKTAASSASHRTARIRSKTSGCSGTITPAKLLYFFSAPRPCRSLCFGAKKRYRSFSRSSLREKSFEIAEKRENNKFWTREKNCGGKKENRMSAGGGRGGKKNICAIMPFVMVFIERRTEHASISNNFFFSCSRFIYLNSSKFNVLHNSARFLVFLPSARSLSLHRSHIRRKYLVKPEKTHSFRTQRVESAGKKRQ